MRPKHIPATVRQRRLGAELRRLRQQAELTTAQAGALDGSSQPRISSIESGRYAVGADRVRALARSYSCTDEAYIEALAEMTGGRTRGWWDEYRTLMPPGALDLAELEHHTTSMRTSAMGHIPGLLQTRAYAHAVISDVVPPFAPHEVEHRVSFRIKRQVAVYGENPKPMTTVLHEVALHMGFGGPEVTRAQLMHLLEVSELEHITISVVPFGAGTFPSAGTGIYYMAGAVPALDTVQLDTDHGLTFLDAPPQLARYRIILDHIERCSLKPSESRDLIRRVAAAL
ncbi:MULTISPECIES: helix-turn-helix domain-containing protein [unclassified Streptomyces]|uniref:helix-turn-helix domain-containing protein n=1 Tax=unclassified Streptomyces TaxID=2593676 RepID=UPI003827F955